MEESIPIRLSLWLKTDTVDQFKSRLDKLCMYHNIKHDVTAETEIDLSMRLVTSRVVNFPEIKYFQ